MHVTPPTTFFRRFAGWVLAGVYLLTLPAVAPLMFGALMLAKGGHAVELVACADHLDVVLHHDHEEEDEPALPPGSGPVFCEDDHDDHVIHFAAATQEKVLTAGMSPAAPVLLTLPEAAWECPRPLLRAQCGVKVLARPPPGRPALLVYLRTIVLIV